MANPTWGDLTGRRPTKPETSVYSPAAKSLRAQWLCQNIRFRDSLTFMTIRIPSPGGGEFSAYMALPRKGKGPGVVVIQEIFGVTPFIRSMCDHLAARQFTAIAPDLYWRTNPNA